MAIKKRQKPAAKGWLCRTAGNSLWLVGALFVIQAFLGINGVFYAFSMRNVIDLAVRRNSPGFFFHLGVLAGLVILQMIFQAVGRYLEERTQTSMESRLKKRLFHLLLHKDYASVNAIHSGEWLNRLTSDTRVAAEGMAQIVPHAAGLLIRLLGAAAGLVYLMPALGLLIISGGFLILLGTCGFRQILKRLHRHVQEEDGKLRVFYQEYLSGLIITRTFGMERQTQQEEADACRRYETARMKRIGFSILCNVGFGGVLDGLYLLGLGFCGYGLLNGTITYGGLMAVLQLIGQIQSPFANLTGYLPQYYGMISSAERLMEAENYAEDCQEEAALTEQSVREFYRDQFIGITLRNACFFYGEKSGSDSDGGENVVIRNGNLQINRGEYVAVTGGSGSGKSTLLKLLLCLYPLENGERLILKQGGGKSVPLTGAWRKLFAYVPQGNHLMIGSIREIVAFSAKEKSRDEDRLRDALRAACALEFVEKLPDGIDTLLVEGGKGLSEGQLQRLSIARAVFSQHPILLLDECTSALDEATEKRLLVNLKSITDRTVLIVTHRQAALSICDKVVEVQGCEIRCLTDTPSALYGK